MEKFRLQYWDQEKSCLAIQWAHQRDDYVAGDFYVRAIRESTDVDEHNKANHQNQIYTIPMPLEKVREFIQRFDLCGEVHDCKGLTLEDECNVIDFDEPIMIRNMRKR